MHLITEDPITPEIAARISALHQSAETSVTVTAQVVSEVSARVPLTESNCCLATSTPETVGFIEKVISFLLSWI